ncbi:hypothetical protein LXL04_037729 [Taraxacum kok-saghyz]
MMKYLQDYLPKPSCDLDHSQNRYGVVFLAPVSYACTLFDPHKKSVSGMSMMKKDPLFIHYMEKTNCHCVCVHNADTLTKKGFSLWNPSIRRKLNIPQCPQRSDPLLEEIGFGFDPLNDDYKIVWFSCATGKENSYVYAMKTGAWCEIASPKPQFTRFSWVDSFSFNGVLHWEVGQSLSKPQDGSFFYIMTFDLSTHVFGMIPLPGPSYDWMTTNITTFKDSLALVSHGRKLNDTWIWIWRDDSWSVGFKLGMGKYPITGALQLQPAKNGDLLLTNYCEWILVYNPNTGVRSKVVEFSADSRLIDCCQYVETLHLLDIGETTSETTQVMKKKLQRSCFTCMQLPFWSLLSLKKSPRHWFLSCISKTPNM